MPTRFEAYRMRDGVTPLSEDFFNTVFGDLDTRVADLEDRRADLQAVINELTEFGLERINATLIPAIQSIDAILQDMLAKKEDLQAAIDRAGSLATVAELAAAVQAEQQARATAIGDEQVARDQAIAQAVDQVVAQPTETTYTYNGDGLVTQIAQTINGAPSLTTITYEAGLVVEIATAAQGRLRVETFTYTNGVVAGSSAITEEYP